MSNNNYIQGNIYTQEGKYVKIYIKKTPKNVAAFIAKCPFSVKIELVDFGNNLILTTMGNFLDHCCDMEFRSSILPDLINMQQWEVEIPKVEFTYDEEDYKSKEAFMDFVEQNTRYSLK